MFAASVSGVALDGHLSDPVHSNPTRETDISRIAMMSRDLNAYRLRCSVIGKEMANIQHEPHHRKTHPERKIAPNLPIPRAACAGALSL